MKSVSSFFASLLLVIPATTTAWSMTRRQALWSTTAALVPSVAIAAENDTPDTFDVDNYLRSGFVSNPMGVSGQAGKSKPETGVLLREGSDISRDARTGDVLAEILLQNADGLTPVLASFASPWSLQTGTVYDVECRDSRTGDGAFLAVSRPVPAGTTSIHDLPASFFLDDLFRPTGRFSFYGSPTDIKLLKTASSSSGNYRSLGVSFSTLSQSTQTEIPRRAQIVATIPAGTQQAVLLVGSTSGSRWKQQSDTVLNVLDSFRAIPAPQTSLKMRAKERRSS